MKKLIVIIGPTASKKTTLAHLISKKINGCIINGDVFQMYKEINSGINKPDIAKLNEVKYYLINNLSITDSYSIFNYQKDFDNIYEQIIKNNQVPILCGGSHLYIDSIIKGYNLDNSIQSKYDEIKNWTDQELISYLKKYDPITADKIINNRHRQIRAVAYLICNNNVPKSTLEKINNKAKYQCLIIMTNTDRQKLYEIINDRFDVMFQNNLWVDEVKNLMKKYDNLVDYQAFKAIGYKEIYNSIINNVDVDYEKIKQKTRKLAKHQLTWCNNKFENKIIFNIDNDDINKLILKIKEFYYD